MVALVVDDGQRCENHLLIEQTEVFGEQHMAAAAKVGKAQRAITKFLDLSGAGAKKEQAAHLAKWEGVEPKQAYFLSFLHKTYCTDMFYYSEIQFSKLQN